MRLSKDGERTEGDRGVSTSDAVWKWQGKVEGTRGSGRAGSGIGARALRVKQRERMWKKDVPATTGEVDSRTRRQGKTGAWHGEARQEHGRQRHAFEVTEIVKIVSVEDRTL